MCILFFYTNPNAQEGKYKIILASNRDEFYVRNAKEASKWNCQPTIISGLDMESGREGGTWLGMGLNEEVKKLRIGVLLNVTGEERKSGAKGRGFIVTDYLKFEENTTEEYINKLKAETNHNAYNFVGIELKGDSIDTHHFSNVSSDANIKYFGENVLGFSNSLPKCPLRKVTEGTKRFKKVVDNFNNTSKNDELVENLIKVLKWDQRHLPDEELKRRAPDSFEMRSSVYVSIPIASYGTRTHTVILVDWNNEIQFIEETMTCPIDIQNIKWTRQVIKARL